MNPLLQTMAKKGNASSPLGKLLGGSSDPKQMLMNQLKSQNPAGFGQLQQLMASGKKPDEILQSMMGQVNPQQMEQLKQMAAQFGFKL